MSKIKLKSKHWELGNHFVKFIDRRWYPDFVLDPQNLELFICAESYGIKSLSEQELDLIKPLINGKVNYELTLRMIHEEMADFWSNHWGWYYPIANTITELFKNRKTESKIYLRALIKIMRSCYDNGFLIVLNNFTGISKESKDKYINNYFSTI